MEVIVLAVPFPAHTDVAKPSENWNRKIIVRAWSDCNGDIESRFSKDEILTQVMICWVTESIVSSFLTYYAYANASALTWVKEGLKNWAGSSKTPVAFAPFPADISRQRRE